MKVEFSNGDIVDRYTILSIKLKRIKDKRKKQNILREYEAIKGSLVEFGFARTHELCDSLKKVNERLWVIEDKIRIKEKNREFDEEFIQLARSVYVENDKRAQIKREINILTESDLIEEKQYEDYR